MVSASSWYTAPDFTTSALQNSKVKFTWDETDQARYRLTRRRIQNENEIHESDFDALIASSSEDDNEAEINDDDNKSKHEKNRHDLRALFEAVHDKGKGQGKFISVFDNDSRPQRRDNEMDIDGDNDGSSDVDMEITFTPALFSTEKNASESFRESVNDDNSNHEHAESSSEKDNETPFEKYLRKRREKRRMKKQAQKQLIEDKIKGNKFEKRKKKQEADKLLKQKNRHDDNDTPSKAIDDKPNSGTDEELVDHNKQHFNMKDIVKATKNLIKKKKKGADARNLLAKDPFEIDLNDERFQNVFDNHHFAIDPTSNL